MTKIVLAVSFMLLFFSNGVFGQTCADPAAVTIIQSFVDDFPESFTAGSQFTGCVTVEEDQTTNFFPINVTVEGDEGVLAVVTVTNSANQVVRTFNVEPNPGFYVFQTPGVYSVRFNFTGGIGTFELRSYTSIGEFGNGEFRYGESSVIGVQANLPVTWTKPLTYSPHGNEVQLDWSVVDQIDVAGYELERDNGEGFFPVSSIPYTPGEGEVNYFALQPWTTEGAYYRVKQLDHAGTFDYTNIVFVPGSTAAMSLSAYPNPAKDFVQVAVPQEVGEVQVLSTTGQIMGTYTASQARSGIDLSNMASGVYFLRSTDESYSVPQRLVVRK